MDMESNVILLYKKDFDLFRDWLGLNWEGVTWQGRFDADFRKFWDLFFIDGLDLKSLNERYDFAKIKINIGPLSSWISWLKEKHIVYIFIQKNLTIKDLAKQLGMNDSQVAYILRSFFIEKFPHQEEYFSEQLHVGNIFCTGRDLNFNTFIRDLDLPPNFKGSIEDEVLNNLEVTLFNEWFKFLKIMDKFSKNENIQVKRENKKNRFILYGKLLRDVTILIVVVFLGFQAIKIGNIWYDAYLYKKIKMFSDYFSSSDILVVKKNSITESKDKIKEELKEIEEFEQKQAKLHEQEEIERYATESDIILTSMESVPQDFHRAEFDDPTKNEDKGGFRDEQFGRKKVYRVMIKTESSKRVNEKIKELVVKYGGESVGDSERIERIVPGGIYYNLYIPQEFETDFLSEVTVIEESMILPSKNRKLPPPGKSKVFIWVKEI